MAERRCVYPLGGWGTLTRAVSRAASIVAARAFASARAVAPALVDAVPNLAANAVANGRIRTVAGAEAAAEPDLLWQRG